MYPVYPVQDHRDLNHRNRRGRCTPFGGWRFDSVWWLGLVVGGSCTPCKIPGIQFIETGGVGLVVGFGGWWFIYPMQDPRDSNHRNRRGRCTPFGGWRFDSVWRLGLVVGGSCTPCKIPKIQIIETGGVDVPLLVVGGLIRFGGWVWWLVVHVPRARCQGFNSKSKPDG